MNSTVAVVLLAIVAILIYQLLRNQSAARQMQALAANPVLGDDNEFIVENDSDSKYPQHTSIELDVVMHWRPLVNHFLVESQFDICFGKSLYEYRIEGTEVQFRQIEDEFEDAGSPKRQDVRDGVVQESMIRDFYKDKTWLLDVDEKVADLKRQTEWQPLPANGYNGFKYFLLSKKLPKPDARRFLRQELERLKLGTAGFYKEAEKYGLEPDDNSLDRFRLADGKLKPSDEQFKALYESAKNFGITDLEFSWGKTLTAQLEKLLRD